jgi:hypothetical protein
VVAQCPSLSRLTNTVEGHLSGGSISGSDDTREEKWTSLSQTGNWLRHKIDTDADGTFELDDTGVFSAANEWQTRDLDSNATIDRYLSHDANGNLTSLGTGASSTALGQGYTYDAFGRMVYTGFGAASGAATYRYNGLGHRIMWQYDVNANESFDDEERYYFCYDERWRVVATYRDDDDSDDAKERFVHHAAGVRGMGGSSYIDSLVLRDRDNSGAGWEDPSDGVLEERVYYIQNWRADVTAVIASDGELLEHVRYSSYGVPRSYPKGDYDLDGDVDAADTTALSNFIAGSGGWNLDFNRDGNVDGDDVTDHATYVSGYVGGSGGPGVQSRAGLLNRVGYAGYQWDHIVQGDHVRHRVYLPALGIVTTTRYLRDDAEPYKMAYDGTGQQHTSVVTILRAMPAAELPPIEHLQQPGTALCVGLCTYTDTSVPMGQNSITITGITASVLCNWCPTYYSYATGQLDWRAIVYPGLQGRRRTIVSCPPLAPNCDCIGPMTGTPAQLTLPLVGTRTVTFCGGRCVVTITYSTTVIDSTVTRLCASTKPATGAPPAPPSGVGPLPIE